MKMLTLQHACRWASFFSRGTWWGGKGTKWTCYGDHFGLSHPYILGESYNILCNSNVIFMKLILKKFKYYNYEKELKIIFKFGIWMWNIIIFWKPTLVVKIIIYGILAINTSNFFGKFYGLWTFNIMKLLINKFIVFFNNAMNLYNDVPWHYWIEKCYQLLDLLRNGDQFEQ
jgi:hypothetical protein